MPPPVICAIPVGKLGSREPFDDRQIAAVHLHQRVAGLFLQLVHVLVWRIFGDFKKELPGEGIALVCSPVEGNPSSTSPGRMPAPVMSFSLSTTPTIKPARSYSPIGIKAGHLRRFAADESASVGPAGLGQAGNHLFRHLIFEFAGGEVVQEEERRCALYRDVVHAVVHQIGAHGVMGSKLEGDLELGAHAIGA